MNMTRRWFRYFDQIMLWDEAGARFRVWPDPADDITY